MNLFSSQHDNDWEIGGFLGAMLYGLTKLMRPEIVLEFGTFRGLSALCFAKAIEEDVLGRKLPSWAKVLTYDIKNYKKLPCFSKNRFIEFHIGDSTDRKFVRALYLKHRGKSRLVFFDTKHSYERVRCEFENLYDLVDEDALVLFHDADTGYERHTAYMLLEDIRKGKYDAPTFRFQVICLPTRWSDDYCLDKRIKDKYGRNLSDGLGIIRKEILR